MRRHLSTKNLFRVLQLQEIFRLYRCIVSFNDWLPLLATYVGLRAFRPGESFRIRGEGLSVTVYELVDISTVYNVFCNPEYLVLPTDSLIIDIGANIGAFTLYAATRAKQAKIIAYEPVGYIFNRLVEQCSQEQLIGRVKLVKAAVGSKDERRKIFVALHGVTSSLFPMASYRFWEEVEVHSIHTVVKQVGGNRISLLKMDCEGCEWEVLHSLTPELATQIDRICLEYHPRDWYDGQYLVALLEGLGFRTLKLRDYGRRAPGVGWFVRQS